MDNPSGAGKYRRWKPLMFQSFKYMETPSPNDIILATGVFQKPSLNSDVSSSMDFQYHSFLLEMSKIVHNDEIVNLLSGSFPLKGWLEHYDEAVD
ncbi:hypothetical protein OUZ56_033427 [Daphnia magna]|uniref:Uncharacterized protein n=1 Tax=Daphnia magna TaxID=35525 RepID=A0ABQ9ZXU0_9CRUS|nr:hypothetical protein OUZ56_033427 [Daphnia magna]